MNTIAPLLSNKNVLLDLDVPNQQALMEAIGRWSEQNRGLKAADVTDGLTAREKLGSTGLGMGVAIPHARISGLKDVCTMFVRTRAAIDFAAPDGNVVSCFFVLLAPAQASEQYLSMLADVAAQFADQEFRERLSTAKTAEEVHQLFSLELVE